MQDGTVGMGVPGDMAESTRVDTETGYGSEAGMAMNIAGGISSAWSQFQSGKTNRELARFNANYQRLRADQARQAGGFAALRRAAISKQLTARIQSQQAASGTVVGAGTNRLVTQAEENASASDEYMLELNADRQATALKIQAAGQDLEGNMAQREGESKAISTLLSTGNQTYLDADSQYRSRMDRH